jgi:hypothetical protein
MGGYLDQSFPKFMEGKIPEVTFVRSLEERKYLQLKVITRYFKILA